VNEEKVTGSDLFIFAYYLVIVAMARWLIASPYLICKTKELVA